MNVSGEKTFAAPRQAVWDVLNDPASMAKTMPGVEGFDIHDAQRWTANVKVPLGLGGLKMKIDMNKVDERPPEHASLDIKGNGVGAMLSMKTSFDLAETDGGTTMRWAADVKLAGPVGSMGQRVLQPIVNQQVAHVLRALDDQVQTRLGEGHLGAAAEGTKDCAPPAQSDHDVDSASGTSGAGDGTSPLEREAYVKKGEE
jgi:uncharacterized protein